MHPVSPVRDILDRSLKTSWIVAVALAAKLAPARPRDAAAILAGQLIAFLHFIFLRKIVKLFTERRERGPLSVVIASKILVIYGGLFAFIAWGRLGYAALCAGFAITFAVLFLKSMLLAFGAGPASLMRRSRVKGSLGAILLAVSLTASSMTVARAQTTGP